jgi:TRAP-type C4-dicarboxylate transport system permease large subunit
MEEPRRSAMQGQRQLDVFRFGKESPGQWAYLFSKRQSCGKTSEETLNETLFLLLIIRSGKIGKSLLQTKQYQTSFYFLFSGRVKGKLLFLLVTVFLLF